MSYLFNSHPILPIRCSLLFVLYKSNPSCPPIIPTLISILLQVQNKMNEKSLSVILQEWCRLHSEIWLSMIYTQSLAETNINPYPQAVTTEQTSEIFYLCLWGSVHTFSSSLWSAVIGNSMTMPPVCPLLSSCGGVADWDHLAATKPLLSLSSSSRDIFLHSLFYYAWVWHHSANSPTIPCRIFFIKVSLEFLQARN